MVVAATVKGDPEAVNKTRLDVIADDSLRQDSTIVKNIVNWIGRGEKGNAIILFSKARINKYVEEAKNKLFQSNLNSVSQRSTPNRQQNGRIEEYRRSLKFLNPNMSNSEIDKKVSEFKEKEYPTNQQSKIDRIKKIPGAMEIENSDLRDAVSYGIGYIYTSDDKDISAADRRDGKSGISEMDKKIIANLFSTGKINVLLATPSIGIGVNVSIRNMYLPSLYKPESTGKDFERNLVLNNKRELSQLVNRAGRGKTPVSNIYTPEEFVPYMREVISMTPDDYNVVPAIAVYPKDTLEDILKRMHDSIPSGVLKSIKFTGKIIGSSSKIAMNFLKQKISEKMIDIKKENQQIDSIEDVTEKQITIVNNFIIKTKQDFDNLKFFISKQSENTNRIQILQKFKEINGNITQFKQSINNIFKNIPPKSQFINSLISLGTAFNNVVLISCELNEAYINFQMKSFDISFIRNNKNRFIGEIDKIITESNFELNRLKIDKENYLKKQTLFTKYIKQSSINKNKKTDELYLESIVTLEKQLMELNNFLINKKNLI